MGSSHFGVPQARVGDPTTRDWEVKLVGRHDEDRVGCQELESSTRAPTQKTATALARQRPPMKRSASPNLAQDQVKKPREGAADRPAQQGLLPAVLAHDSVAALAAQYKASGPYRHCVAQDLFDDDLLKAVREEVSLRKGDANSGLGSLCGFNQKETDIYKVRSVSLHHTLDAC